jgi:hypothetical protein
LSFFFCLGTHGHASSNDRQTTWVDDNLISWVPDGDTKMPWWVYSDPYAMSWCCTMLFAACRCGTNQTGGFVQGSSASDGLLGLGLADISVPSTMARQGVAQNSFSMCFALDGSGRIVFGDRGPPKQPSTPLVKPSHLWAFPIPTTSLAPYLPIYLSTSCLHAYLPSFLNQIVCNLSFCVRLTYLCLFRSCNLASKWMQKDIHCDPSTDCCGWSNCCSCQHSSHRWHWNFLHILLYFSVHSIGSGGKNKKILSLKNYCLCVFPVTHVFQKFPVFFSLSFLSLFSSVCNWASVFLFELL